MPFVLQLHVGFTAIPGFTQSIDKMGKYHSYKGDISGDRRVVWGSMTLPTYPAV